jgi:hypothetical protein
MIQIPRPVLVGIDNTIASHEIPRSRHLLRPADMEPFRLCLTHGTRNVASRVLELAFVNGSLSGGRRNFRLQSG